MISDAVSKHGAQAGATAPQNRDPQKGSAKFVEKLAVG